MAFEVGKRYQRKDGGWVRVLCTDRPSTEDLTMIVLRADKSNQTCEYYLADGRMREWVSSNDPNTLIDPDVITTEEREILVRILEAFHFPGTARLISENKLPPHNVSISKALEALRNESR
jgi:hypothetical protein